jgi:CDP-diacylglycerol--glycerol-3-phosphate 3-phosphatidyltransferase
MEEEGKEEKKRLKKIRLPKFKDAILLPPNILTFVRILFVPVIVLLLLCESRWPGHYFSVYSAWMFILAGVTDFLDGYLARKMKMRSTVGKVLDPLADKLMVICLLIMLVPLGRVSALVVVVVVSREFIITALRTLASAAGIIIAADNLGKFKTILQIIAIPALLFDNSWFYFHSYDIGRASLYLSVVFSLLSAFVYMRNFFESAKDMEF